ncbi:MAG: ATP-binding protein [Muribaculaceae bacterium]|nr:ATP-binding protein [Muribaculaceae bacterium]
MANLVVGKNSSGKSRTLHAFGIVKSVLSQRYSKEDKFNFDSEIVFIDNKGHELSLSLSINGQKVLKEILKVDGVVKIYRSGPSGRIEDEVVNPPEDMLLMHVRRDVAKYDYIEEIISWAENTVIRSFIDCDSPSQSELFDIVSKFTPVMKHNVINMANEVGFPLRELDTFDNIFKNFKKKSSNSDSEGIMIRFIILNEKNVGYLTLNELSSGMYRTLLLLILIEQLRNLDYPALLAIDDLGEGLDYSRATKVGKKLFEICEEKKVQVIATSNEEFMMNIVDISKWNILVRKGNVVKSITSDFCPDEFEEFKFSGLSNFDFFTSDFLNGISSKLFRKKK